MLEEHELASQLDAMMEKTQLWITSANNPIPQVGIGQIGGKNKFSKNSKKFSSHLTNGGKSTGKVGSENEGGFGGKNKNLMSGPLQKEIDSIQALIDSEGWFFIILITL